MQIQQLKEFQETQHPVLSLDCETPLMDAIRHMDAHNYGSVICTRKGEYHGIFTARQLVRKLASNENFRFLQLRDVVRTDGPVARLDDDAEKKLSEMNAAQVHYMPIVNKDNRCIGMLSQGDFATYTLDQATVRFTEALKDKAEKRINPPSMVVMMILYAAVILGVGTLII